MSPTYPSQLPLYPPHPIPVFRVPVTAEDRPIVGCEHPLTAVRPPNVPELHIAILKGGSKGEVVPDAELDVPHTLRLACGQDVDGERR